MATSIVSPAVISPPVRDRSFDGSPDAKQVIWYLSGAPHGARDCDPVGVRGAQALGCQRCGSSASMSLALVTGSWVSTSRR